MLIVNKINATSILLPCYLHHRPPTTVDLAEANRAQSAALSTTALACDQSVAAAAVTQNPQTLRGVLAGFEREQTALRKG